MKTLKLIPIVIFCIIYKQSHTQTTVVQDVKGESSLNIGKDGIVAINAKDESLSFSFGELVGSDLDASRSIYKYFGIKAKGKAKNSVSTLIKNEDFQFDGSLGGFFFSEKTNIVGKTDKITQRYVGADIIWSRFKLYDKSLAFDKQVYDESQGGSRFTAGLTIKNSWKKKVAYVFGISANTGQKNNSEDLKALSISTFRTDTNSSTGQFRFVQQDAVSAYDITKYKNSLGYFNLNMDFGPSLTQRFLLLGHIRWSVLQARYPRFNPAVGLYINKDKSPLEVVAGIQVQALDFFNTADSEKKLGERTVLNLVAGFTF